MALIDILDNRSLTSALNLAVVPGTLALDTVFKQKELHASDKIDIEIYSNNDSIAQFVGKSDQAVQIKKGGRVAKTVTLPRTYEKRLFTADELADYYSLGTIYSSNTNDRARASNDWVKREVENLKYRIIRRREAMALEALSTGKIQVSQANTSFSIDFEYVATKHLITLASGAKWTPTNIKAQSGGADPTVNPLVDVRAWKSSIMKNGGYNANLVLMGSSAAAAFISASDVTKTLDASNKRAGTMDLTLANNTSGVYIGSMLGMDFYEYNQQYTNSSGVTVDYLDPNKVVVLATNGPFRLHCGPVSRISGGGVIMIPSEFYLESIEDQEESTLIWRSEQKSLPTIHDPNAVISVTVL